MRIKLALLIGKASSDIACHVSIAKWFKIRLEK